jgi:hypothetical protein
MFFSSQAKALNYYFFYCVFNACKCCSFLLLHTGSVQLEAYCGCPRKQQSPGNFGREGATEIAQETLQEAQAAHDVQVL